MNNDILYAALITIFAFGAAFGSANHIERALGLDKPTQLSHIFINAMVWLLVYLFTFIGSAILAILIVIKFIL